MPAENDPADPNALTQSLQLTCSLTPSSTEPSTRLVIIWLKRCLARPPIDPPLESAPVGVGAGDAWDVGEGLGEGDALGVGVGVGVGSAQSPSQSPTLVVVAPVAFCADAGDGCSCASTSQANTVSAAEPVGVRGNLFIVSARTACRWDRCRHRREASRLALHPHTGWCCKVLPPLRRSRRRSRAGCWSSES